MKKHILLAAAASLALMPAAYAQSNKSGAAQEQSQLRPVDQTFVTKAASGGMFEVQSSELAGDKAESNDVKKFAKRMIKDHGKANGELEKLGGQIGADVPSELDAKHAAALQKLEGLEGAEFDAAYIQAQRAAHKEAVGLFSTYSKAGGNPDLTAWATETLPTLQEHAQHIQGLNVAQSEGSSSMGRSAAEPESAPRQ
jgi:putative membrane protein